MWIFKIISAYFVLNHLLLCRLVKVGLELEKSFGGSAANLVKSAGNSAASLIELITRHFPGNAVIAHVLLFNSISLICFVFIRLES
jgi:hypothetical protein